MPATLLRKPLPKPSPDSDPRYRRVMEQLKTKARHTAAHPPAKKKAGDAAAWAKGPPTERVAAGKAKQVDKIQAAKESKPEPSSFLAVLRAEVAKAMPKTLGETEHFDEAAQQMKGGLKGNVAEQKQKSTQDVSGTTAQRPEPTGEPKVETPLPKEGAPPSPDIPAAQAMPAPKSDADISLQDSKENVDQQMKEAEVTPTQLQKANDPRFSAVLTAKDDVAKNADAGPAKYRAAEGPVLAAAAAGATTSARVGAAAMLGVHHGASGKVLTRQQQQKARDEAKRKEVVDKIEAIYTATKERVEKKLDDLETEVNTLFDIGVDGALATMTLFIDDKIDAWKSDRYAWNPLAWVKDKLAGLPPEVDAFYEQGRQVFQKSMDKLIVLVATLVEVRLKEAKAEVAKGQAEIRKFVESQPKELQQVAKHAEADVASRFHELEQGIDDKKNQLAQSLAQKYKDAFDKANTAIKAIQEANKGLVTKFAEKLGEILKALREFKARVSAVLKKSEDTIKRILSDPIGFLGNLIDAIKGGISRFVDNIWEHLKAGFMEWLFGNLPPGVEIPGDFSIASIFKLVLGVLGITYDRMRAKAVKLIGERNVKIIEKVADYVRTLITGGIGALWEQVKTDLGNLKEMVIDALQEWLITTLIKKAIAKIVLLFNPVGAIIQAILAIVDVVMFVVEKAAQILAFVESVINSIADIAAGAIDSASKKVETSLARTIPLLIGFLARFLGLSGITDKIREFILKVQDRVDKAIDKAIAKIVEVVKKTVAKLVGGKDPGPDERTPEQKEADLKEAVAKGTAALAAQNSSPRKVRSILKKLKEQYRLTELTLKQDDSKEAHIAGSVNPTMDGDKILYADVEELLKSAPDDVRDRLQQAIDKAANYADAAKKLYDDHLAAVQATEITVPPGKTEAEAKQQKIKEKEIAEKKTFAVAEGKGATLATMSGWAIIPKWKRDLAMKQHLKLWNLYREIEKYVFAKTESLLSLGYDPQPSDYDRFEVVDGKRIDKPGTFYITHAEKQAFSAALEQLRAGLNAAAKEEKATNAPPPGVVVSEAPAPADDWRHLMSIGVSRKPCDEDCAKFFKAAARLERVNIVIGDPHRVWLFRPDGTVSYLFRPKK